MAFRAPADIVNLVILAGALIKIVRCLVGYGFDPFNILAVVAGAVAVMVQSFTERFRVLVRADPHEPFSMVYPNDRRRRRLKTSAPALNGASPSQEIADGSR